LFEHGEASRHLGVACRLGGSRVVHRVTGLCNRRRGINADAIDPAQLGWVDQIAARAARLTDRASLTARTIRRRRSEITVLSW
jgi:hypothetical protein